MDKLVALITTSGEDEALKIANALVEEKLAACVNILPNVRSVYRWKGELCNDQEFLLLAKTDITKFERLMNQVIKLHSYDTPEIISLPITGGSRKYLDWVDASLD